MTLVASFVVDSIPMLIGDVLLSRRGADEVHVELPSVGDSRGIVEPGWGLSLQLGQKLCTVNPFITIGWSGSYLAARVCLDELRRVVGDAPLAPDRAQAILDELYRSPEFADLAVVGLAVGPAGQSYFMHLRGSLLQSRNFGTCHFAGSGSDDFAATIQDADDFAAAAHVEGPAHFRAFSAASMLVGTFLTREANSRSLEKDEQPNPLLALYGGGWEIALCLDGHVGKIDETTTVCWDAVEERGGFRVGLPSLILQRGYRGETLLKRWARGGETSVWRVPWSDQRCVSARSLLDGAAQVDVNDHATWPPWSSPVQLHSILVTREDGRRYVLNWARYSPSPSSDLRVNIREDQSSRSTVFRVTRSLARAIALLSGRAVDRSLKLARAAPNEGS